MGIDEEGLRGILAGSVAEEILNGQERVRDRYLTGMLAPQNTLGVDADRADGAGVDGDDSAQEADVEDRTAATPSLFPVLLWDDFRRPSCDITT